MGEGSNIIWKTDTDTCLRNKHSNYMLLYPKATATKNFYCYLQPT